LLENSNTPADPNVGNDLNVAENCYSLFHFLQVWKKQSVISLMNSIAIGEEAG